jgi:hypothetical protein
MKRKKIWVEGFAVAVCGMSGGITAFQNEAD